MMFFLFQHDKVFQLLVLSLVTAFFCIDNIAYARGYGSGSGVGENYNDYMPRVEARFFVLYDTNKNGFLSSTEVIGMRMSPQTFKHADINKNGRLSRAEFSKMWAQPPTRPDTPIENY